MQWPASVQLNSLNSKKRVLVCRLHIEDYALSLLIPTMSPENAFWSIAKNMPGTILTISEHEWLSFSVQEHSLTLYNLLE